MVFRYEWPDSLLKRIKGWREEGRTFGEISELIGRSAHAIRAAAVRHGIHYPGDRVATVARTNKITKPQRQLTEDQQRLVRALKGYD